jgi:hypothetical protein
LWSTATFAEPVTIQNGEELLITYTITPMEPEDDGSGVNLED